MAPNASPKRFTRSQARLQAEKEERAAKRRRVMPPRVVFDDLSPLTMASFRSRASLASVGTPLSSICHSQVLPLITPRTSVASTVSTVSTEEPAPKKRKRNLTENERHAVLHCLLRNLNKAGEPKRGMFKEVAAKFNCECRVTSRIWNRCKSTASPELPAGDISGDIKKNSGRKLECTKEEMESRLEKIPHCHRGAMADLEARMNTPAATLWRYLKRGVFKKFDCKIKPVLKPSHRIARVNFIHSHLDEESGEFDPMHQTIHIDEKWFHLNKTQRRVCLTCAECEDEDKLPVEKGNKRHRIKVMLLCAVARPRFDIRRNQWFDGKIGMWPFTHMVAAKRNSKRRKKGTLETKPRSVNAALCKEFMLEKVLPAIHRKWPAAHRKKPVWINEDNSRCHPEATRLAVQEAAALRGWDIRRRPQPANSPDFNALDLGFFNSIQSLHCKSNLKTIDELVKNVRKAFRDVEQETLDNTLMSLQLCMEPSLERGGNNTHKLGHRKKKKKTNKPALPYNIVPQETLEKGFHVLGGPCMHIPAPMHPLLASDEDSDPGFVTGVDSNSSESSRVEIASL